MSFAVNLKSLPKVSHVESLTLTDAEGNVVGMIENKQGQTGSLAVYNHLAQTFGAITPDAAVKGLEIYAEHTEDARAHPGKHPNIDRLFELLKTKQSLRVKHAYATDPGIEGLRP